MAIAGGGVEDAYNLEYERQVDIEFAIDRRSSQPLPTAAPWTEEISIDLAAELDEMAAHLVAIGGTRSPYLVPKCAVLSIVFSITAEKKANGDLDIRFLRSEVSAGTFKRDTERLAIALAVLSPDMPPRARLTVEAGCRL